MTYTIHKIRYVSRQALLYAVILFPMHRVFALQTETHEGKLRVFVLLDEADEALVLSESFFKLFFVMPMVSIDPLIYFQTHRSSPLISDKVMSVYTKPFRRNRSINLKGLLCKFKINISLDVTACRG